MSCSIAGCSAPFVLVAIVWAQYSDFAAGIPNKLRNVLLDGNLPKRSRVFQRFQLYSRFGALCVSLVRTIGRAMFDPPAMQPARTAPTGCVHHSRPCSQLRDEFAQLRRRGAAVVPDLAIA